VATLVARTPSRADAGEAATDLVRPELTEDGLASHRADFELTRAATDALYEELLPAYADELGFSPAVFASEVLPGYPALAALADPAARADTYRFAEGIVANLEAHQDDFAEADAIPVGWLPMTAGPWVALAAAALVVGAGAWAALRGGRAPLVTLVVLGALAVVGPLAARYPQKADAADDLLATLDVTPEIAAQTRELLVTAQDAQAELEGRFLPDLASGLGLTQPELDADIATRFPAVATGRDELPAVFARYERRVEIREGGLEVIPEAKRFPLGAVTWWAVVPGALLALAAGIALVTARTGRAAAPPPTPPLGPPAPPRYG
jgi:hypothetical protein